ncbi:MAG: flagellar basal body-associated protein FliL [Syntrophobacteraceae bacterium]
MPPEAEEQKTEKPKGKSKLLLIILPVVLLLFAGGGAFAYFKFFKGGDEKGEAKKQAEQAVIQEIDTFMVNLMDTGGKRFLKLTMKVKCSSAPLADEFKSRNFEMRDIILLILMSKEYEDVTKPEDKVNLKKEIVTALNRTLKKGQVLDVYFTDFLVQ